MDAQQDQKQVVMPPVPTHGKGFSFNLKRTGGSFVAEYSIFLISLSFVLGGVMWLVSILSGLILSAMMGGGALGYFPVTLFVLWIAVVAFVALPVAAIFWSRTQGELAATYNNEFPRGGARGFRSVWLVLSGVQAMVALIVALYAPLAAAVSSAGALGQIMVSVSLPALLGVGITLLGIFIVASSTQRRKHVCMALWAVTVITFLLIIITYPWAASAQQSSSNMYRQYESTPTQMDSRYDNPYSDDLYKY